MLRTPDLRWLARHLAPGLLAELGSARQTDGVALYRRRADLTSSLAAALGGGREQGHAATSSEWFGQAGNILAWISYQHRQLRDSYGDSDNADNLRQEYMKLQRYYDAVGSRSGVTRTHLLPGAHRAFPTREILAGVFDLQYGWWQRFRIVTHHIIRREWWRLRQRRTAGS